MTASLQASDRTEPFRSRVADLLENRLRVLDFEEDDDRDFMFRYQGGTYLLCFHESDPTYAYVRYPGFYDLSARVARATVLDACMDAIRSVKLVKTYVEPGFDGTETVSACVDFVVTDPAQLDEKQLGRFLDAIQVAVRTFYEALATAGGQPPLAEIELDPPQRRSRRKH